MRVRRDTHQVFFTSSPPPTRPRHANIPSWHYDMLNDAGRGLHSFPFPLNLSLLCPCPLNLSLRCPPYIPD